MFFDKIDVGLTVANVQSRHADTGYHRIPIGPSGERGIFGMALATVNLNKRVAEIVIDRVPGDVVASSLPAELLAIFAQLRHSPPDVILLRTDGSAGFADDREGAARPVTAPDLRRADFERAVFQLEDMPMPTLAVVQGDCIAGGFQLALGCDLIIAARTSQFSFPETALGLPPMHAGIAQIAARVGQSRAIELAFLGTALDAEEMERLNIVSRVVDDDRLIQEARALGARLAAGPTQAYASVKSMLRAWRSGGVDAARTAIPNVARTFYAELAADPI